MPLTFRSFGLALCLVALCAASALAGCGGGDPLTAEESAQHAADMAALATLRANAEAGGTPPAYPPGYNVPQPCANCGSPNTKGNGP